MYDQFITASALQYQVPEAWIRAVIQTESSWNARAYRAESQINDASYGLMQLLFKTAAALGYAGVPEGLFDPQINIDLGTKLLAQLRSKYGENAERVYSAYNSGNPDKYLSSSEIGANVDRFMANLENAIREHPFVASTGALGVAAIAAVLLWAWGKRKK